MNKRRSIFWIVAGGYLVYLGVSMFQSVRVEQPANYMYLYAAAGFFSAVGALLAVTGLRSLLNKPQAEEAIVVDEENNSESDDGSLESKESESEPYTKEPEPRRAKTMRERAMLGNVITDDTREVHTTSASGDTTQWRSATEEMPNIPINPSLQNTDVDIASEDIIAATEEIIATQESENAIANINRSGNRE